MESLPGYDPDSTPVSLAYHCAAAEPRENEPFAVEQARDELSNLLPGTEAESERQFNRITIGRIMREATRVPLF